jgi:predicted transposase
MLSEPEKCALRRTMDAFSEAFRMAANWGFEDGTSNKLTAYHATYHEVRRKTGLSASLVESTRDCACDALRAEGLRHLPKRNPHASLRYVKREARIMLDMGEASIVSIDGRIRTRYLNASRNIALAGTSCGGGLPISQLHVARSSRYHEKSRSHEFSIPCGQLTMGASSPMPNAASQSPHRGAASKTSYIADELV